MSVQLSEKGGGLFVSPELHNRLGVALLRSPISLDIFSANYLTFPQADKHKHV